jgi:hypothetical protein
MSGTDGIYLRKANDWSQLVFSNRLTFVWRFGLWILKHLLSPLRSVFYFVSEVCFNCYDQMKWYRHWMEDICGQTVRFTGIWGDKMEESEFLWFFITSFWIQFLNTLFVLFPSKSSNFWMIVTISIIFIQFVEDFFDRLLCILIRIRYLFQNKNLSRYFRIILELLYESQISSFVTICMEVCPIHCRGSYRKWGIQTNDALSIVDCSFQVLDKDIIARQLPVGFWFACRISQTVSQDFFPGSTKGDELCLSRIYKLVKWSSRDYFLSFGNAHPSQKNRLVIWSEWLTFSEPYTLERTVGAGYNFRAYGWRMMWFSS